MRRLLLTCILVATQGIAPAQKGAQDTKQNTIDVPNPVVNTGDQQIQIGLYRNCPDVNAPLLDIIKGLMDADSVNNEVKYEEDNHLNADKVYARRINIIKARVQVLRTH